MARPRGLFAGLATLDVVSRVPELPGPDRKLQAIRQDLAAGGPAANAAVTFAALGGAAVLLTVLGRHPIARLVQQELRGRGVRVVDAGTERTTPPPVSAVTVLQDTGERSVVSPRGVGVEVVTVPELPAADVVLLDGHYPALARAAVRHGREQGARVLLDSGSWKPVLDEVLAGVDVAACSAAFRTPGAANSAEAAAGLRARVPTVLVTRGAEPVQWWSGAACGEVAVPAVRAVDTLAAGDVFHGALAFALLRVPLPAAIEFANAVAAVRCATAGPRDWLGDDRLAELASSLTARR